MVDEIIFLNIIKETKYKENHFRIFFIISINSSSEMSPSQFLSNLKINSYQTFQHKYLYFKYTSSPIGPIASSNSNFDK